MKTPDLEIYEAAREYLSAFQESEELHSLARDASAAAYSRKRDLIKLLHELYDIQETMALHLEDGRLLVCHYNCEEGFVNFTEIQAFVEVDKIPPIAETPKPEDFSRLFDPEDTAMNELRAEFYGDEILLGGIDDE